MLYFLNRGGARYGPYTVDDVRRYLAAGNIAADDAMEPEAGGDTVQASALVTASAAAEPAPGTYSQAQGYGSPQPAAPHGGAGAWAPHSFAATIPPNVPPPPAMDWWLVLILSLVTCTLFGFIWAFIQSRWVKKIDPGSRAWLYLLLSLLVLPVVFALAIGSALAAEFGGVAEDAMGLGLGLAMLVLGLGASVATVAAFVSMNSSLTERTAMWGGARIDLGGIFIAMVFVGLVTNILYAVAPVWIQYHLNRVRDVQLGRMGGGAGGGNIY